MVAPTTVAPPRAITSTVSALSRYIVAPTRATGRQILFYGGTYVWMPRALNRYRKEIIRLLAGVSLGTGTLAAIGGTVTVIGLMSGFAGAELGVQGYSQLSNVGVQSLAGFVAAYAITREGAPLMAGISLIATVGAGFTAQLGAMRVSEEIDALEVMAVPSVPFLVTTRLLAGMIAILPLFGVALMLCYGATKLVVVLINHQPTGTYDHYFNIFLIPEDVLISLFKSVIMSVIVMSVHCYYGYTTTGGPVGVGRAVGKAVRLSLVLIMFVDLGLSLALYGNSNTLHLSS